jgi:hypothetical protein
MQHRMTVGPQANIATIESLIRIAEDRHSEHEKFPTSSNCSFLAKFASGDGVKNTSFRDVWESIALASLKQRYDCGSAIAWGLSDWAAIEKVEHPRSDTLPFSPAGLYAVGSDLEFRTDSNSAPVLLDADKVIQSLRERDYELGKDGSSERAIVEFDAGNRRAPALTPDAEKNAKFKFKEFIDETRAALEINGNKLHEKIGDAGAARALARFLYELRLNGMEYAASAKSVRFMRLKKRRFNNRRDAVKWAESFPRLADYLGRGYSHQGEVYFVEVSVSDFGPGIVDGYLSSPRGGSWKDMPRPELLRQLLVTQLSSKWGDPGAGFGIQDALKSARAMNAFVSLRTNEFWQYQDAFGDTEIGMQDCQSEPLAHIAGTHWQMIYPHSASL